MSPLPRSPVSLATARQRAHRLTTTLPRPICALFCSKMLAEQVLSRVRELNYTRYKIICQVRVCPRPPSPAHTPHPAPFPHFPVLLEW